jgi:trypsin-like peptidase
VMGTVPDGDKYVSREACGTASQIGGGVYLTAAHVVARAQTFPMAALAVIPDGRKGTLHRITEIETFPDFDLAIFRAGKANFGQTFRWTDAPAALLDEVRAFGYPWGFNPESGHVNVRGFSGEVVGGTPIDRLPARPHGIELSFPCPRGLSGAPVIRMKPEPHRITGVVIASTITDVTVYREEEKSIEGDKESIFIKTEALHLGLAIRADAVFGIKSDLLRCTLGEWLHRHGLRE